VLRYVLNLACYDLTPDMTLITPDENKRYYTMEEDRKNDNNLDEPMSAMLEFLYE
jgi:hypothetical protein